jgi:spermidine synthase
MERKKIILIAFVLSGMAALIYEVVWTRPLQFVLGSTIYTVSIILATFMGGLGLGSWVISKFVDKIKNLPAAYALMELGIGLYGVLLLILFNILPHAYRAIYPIHQNFYVFEFLQLLLTFGILLIPTTLMGATFPVIAKFYTQRKVGKGIGEIYSANNLGAIFGSFAAGFMLIPILGIKSTVIFAALINIFAAFLILFFFSKTLAKKIIPLAIPIFLVLSYTGSYNIRELYSGGFYRAELPAEVWKSRKIVFYKEGLHATITVTESPDKALTLLINGKGQGSTSISDLRVNFLLAYLPLLNKPKITNALVIGLGTGTTSGQLAQFINVTTVEIEPAVIDASKYFWFVNFNVLENPNHELVIADARNYLLQSRKKYDVIVQEPSDPWQSFSTALYSKEFFKLVKNNLDEDGLFVKWVPIYTMSPEDWRSFYRTFTSVFPYVLAFANVKEDEPFPVRLSTSEILLIGSTHEIELDTENLRKNFDALPSSVKKYLQAIQLNSADDLLHLFLFSSEDMKGYADNAPLITDDNPALEFSTAKNVLVADPKDVINDINEFLGAKSVR